MSVIESLKTKNTLSTEEYKNRLMELNIQLFASSGTLGSLSGSYKTTYTVTWSLRSQDIATNKSKIRLYGTLTTGNTTYIGSLYNADEFTIEGTKVHGGWEKQAGTSGTVTVWQEYIDIEVKHNDDGTFPNKKVSFTAYDHVAFTTKQSGSGYIYAYNEKNHPEGVPTIPRASSVSCSSENIGDTHTITIGKKATTFTNTVTYKIGTLTGTIAEKTSETVLQLDTSSLKQEIYALMPNDKKISGTIICTTYNGDTQIGEPTTATFNLYAVEEDCKPEVSGTVVDTNEITSQFGKLIKYISKPKVTVEATPKYSSSIKSYSINLNDGQTSSEQEYTFDTINSNKITVGAVDSRGYPNSYEIDLTEKIVDYVKLHFNSIELSRPEGTSNEVILDCDGVWFNSNFNEATHNFLTINFLYRISGETEWINGGEITPTIDGNKFSFNNYSLGDLFDYNEEYQVKIIATDLLMTVGDSNKESIPVPKGQEVWFECEDGIGVYGHIWLNDEEILNIDNIYPVGSIYMSTNETNPEILFGGTWEEITGRFLLGRGPDGNGWNEKAGVTGGEWQHTLTVDEMPNHNHKDLNWATDTYHLSIDSGSDNGLLLNTDYQIEYTEGKMRTGYTGGGQAHNNMPPYLTVYMWKRIA